MKTTAQFVLIAVLVLSGLVARADPTDPPECLRINGFLQQDAVMVSVGDVLKFLGYSIQWDPMTDRISLQNSSGALLFVVGEAQCSYLAQGAAQPAVSQLTVAPRYAGYLLHGPLSEMLTAARIPVKVDQETQRRISYRTGDKLILVDLWPEEDKIALDLARGSLVKLQTTVGNIYLDLFDEAVPVTAGNFMDLVARGFYDGLTFHRVIAGFMIQGGCPRGDGTGSPGYTIPDEIVKGLRHRRGSLSMAKTEPPDTGGCQFFICHRPQPHLDGVHTVFGRCVSGMAAVDEMRAGGVIKRATILRQSDHAADAIAKALAARVPDAQ